MIEPSSPWISHRESAWHPHSFNYMTVNAATSQPDHMPTCLDSHHVSTRVGSDGYNVFDMPGKKSMQIKDGVRFNHNFLFPKTNVNTSSNSHQLDFSTGNDWKEIPNGTSYSQQKKILIFDRSAEETRMVLRSLCSPICSGAAANAFRSEKTYPKLSVLSENPGEGSEYREDTEEIDALLYSSDDDIRDHEDEDEISTGRSPNAMNNGYENTEEREDLDEVSSFWRSSKKRKHLEGVSYSKLSSTETKALAKSASRYYDDESVANPSLSCKRNRMHKIHDTLRVLQKLIPDSNTQDPLVIIEETISYLKSLKEQSLNMEKACSSCQSTPLK